MNEEFNENRLQKTLKNATFPIVHFATHAQFSSKAEDTFLLTYDDRINVKNFDQLLRETEDKPIPIELLILSACEAASGDNRAPLGLAGVAVRSGAKSTLATLCPVNDQSTAQFMTQFYPALNQPGKSKAEALRQAQLSLLQDKKYQHPYF
jgi:CHAT domain-containing protein